MYPLPDEALTDETVGDVAGGLETADVAGGLETADVARG